MVGPMVGVPTTFRGVAVTETGPAIAGMEGGSNSIARGGATVTWRDAVAEIAVPARPTVTSKGKVPAWAAVPASSPPPGLPDWSKATPGAPETWYEASRTLLRTSPS